MTSLDRRSFLKASGVTAGVTLLSSTGLQVLSTRMAEAAPGKGHGRARNANADYGPIVPTASVNTGEQWLALPAGFSYSIFSKTGGLLSDGNVVPRSHDGMGAFGSTQRGGEVRLIRNHEIRFNRGPSFSQGTFTIDPVPGSYDMAAEGGTTTLRFDARQFRTASGGLVQDYVSATGTVVNCAGGIAFRQAGWLTCEEIVQEEAPPNVTPGSVPQTDKDHGYVYLTPLGTTAGNPATPQPFVEMGRFAHEAACVDDRTGIVYMTEDAGSGRGSGFYRFLPHDATDLSRGGVLQILGLKGNRGQADLREGQEMGKPLPVQWITIEEPNPSGAAPNAVFLEGYAKGAAKFNRLEGCWDGSGSIFFASTSGGNAKNGDVNSDGFAEGYGQIWEYIPRGSSGGQLVLLFESPDGDVLDSPDNIVVSPRGGLVLCEDDSSGGNLGQDDTSEFFGEDKNRLIGLTLQGRPFPFAENIVNDSELAGACWSDDGEFLFVNIFGYDRAGSGGTLAITGPWANGAL